MNELYDRMLSAYDQSTDAACRNAIYEVSQQIVLAGLADGGFFDKAAFYGGTCLRIFHGLNRFSEDMDFTLLKEDGSFRFEQYFQPVIDQFALVGRRVEIRKKDKRGFGKVESAFLKDNTEVGLGRYRNSSIADAGNFKGSTRLGIDDEFTVRTSHGSRCSSLDDDAGARNGLALRINYYAIGCLAKGYRADTEPEGQCQQNIL